LQETAHLGPPHGEQPPPLAACYEQAALATATGSKSFYFATRFFPPDLARAAHAVYWFCRHTDDTVDEAPSIAHGSEVIEAWHKNLLRAWDRGASADPILHLFVTTARRYEIPLEYPLELIEGMRMDLHGVRYQTFDDLRLFCYRVASVVGLMMSHVIGYRGDALRYAIDLGIAMQLTNILRDVGEDLCRCRIYLPSDELAQFGYPLQQLYVGQRTDQFRELMEFQVARAHDYYKRAYPGIQLLNQDGRFAVRVAADVYRGILKEIVDNDYDVFSRRAVVPATRKYWITARNMARPMARHALLRLAFWKSLDA